VAEVGLDAKVIQANCIEAALACLASSADVSLVLLESMLPDSNGLDGLKRVHAAHPEVPVVVLSALAIDLAMVQGFIGAGAKGVLCDCCPSRVLVQALRLVLVGGVYVPPHVIGCERGPRTASPPPTSETCPAPRLIYELRLTPRQMEVLELIAQGKPNKLICRALKLAEATVKTHAAAIYQALGVSNRTEAAFVVSRFGSARGFAPSPAGHADTRHAS
jgi:DNA-binding NarL/FixJ family response regulator